MPTARQRRRQWYFYNVILPRQRASRKMQCFYRIFLFMVSLAATFLVAWSYKSKIDQFLNADLNDPSSLYDGYREPYDDDFVSHDMKESVSSEAESDSQPEYIDDFVSENEVNNEWVPEQCRTEIDKGQPDEHCDCRDAAHEIQKHSKALEKCHLMMDDLRLATQSETGKGQSDEHCNCRDAVRELQKRSKALEKCHLMVDDLRLALETGTETVKRKLECRDVVLELHKHSRALEICHTSVDDLKQSLEQTRMMLSRKKKNIRKSESENLLKETENHMIKRYVALLLKQMEVQNSEMNSELEICLLSTVSPDDISILKEFIKGDGVKTHHIDTIMARLFQRVDCDSKKGFRHSLFDAVRAAVEFLFYRSVDQFLIACVLTTMATMTFLIWKGESVGRCIAVLVGFMFITSYLWNWKRLLYESNAKKQAYMSTNREKPLECYPEKMSWYGAIHDYIRQNVFGGEDRCELYYRELGVDPVWDVSPDVVLKETVVAFVVTIPTSIGAGFGAMYKGVTDIVGFWLGLVIFLLLLVFLIISYMIWNRYELSVMFGLLRIQSARHQEFPREVSAPPLGEQNTSQAALPQNSSQIINNFFLHRPLSVEEIVPITMGTSSTHQQLEDATKDDKEDRNETVATNLIPIESAWTPPPTQDCKSITKAANTISKEYQTKSSSSQTVATNCCRETVSELTVPSPTRSSEVSDLESESSVEVLPDPYAEQDIPFLEQLRLIGEGDELWDMSESVTESIGTSYENIGSGDTVLTDSVEVVNDMCSEQSEPTGTGVSAMTEAQSCEIAEIFRNEID